MLHREAREVLRSAFAKVVGRAPTERALDMVQAVAWGETLYGRGGQFAKLAQQGLHNWGALEKGTPPCPDGFAPGKDHDGNGKLIDVCFYVYPTDEQAASKFLGILLQHRGDPNRRVQAAVDNGTPEEMAAAMRAFGYFAAPVSSYAAMIRNNLGVGRRPGGITDAGQVITKDPPGTAPPAPPANVDPGPIINPPPLSSLATASIPQVSTKSALVGLGIVGAIGAIGYGIKKVLS